MAVFRIEKTQNYTVMSNHHLRNKTLTLKAKGLLSQMLSLPDNWDYTLAGLSHINRESVEAIRTAVLELETAGYIIRRQRRDDRGKMGNIEYTIYEQPQEPDAPEFDNQPLCDFPITDKPITENPSSDFPTSDNATQLSKEALNKNKSITDLSSTYSIPLLSPRERENDGTERNGTEAKSMSAIEIYRDIILDNIEYPFMLERYPYDHDSIDGIVDLMLETVCTARKTIRIAGDDYPAELVKSKFLKLTSTHIEFVMDCMKNNTTEIRSIKKYLLAVLFNAPSTIDPYYTALVAHDMASGKLYGGGDK
jgi:hypothetical protein